MRGRNELPSPRQGSRQGSTLEGSIRDRLPSPRSTIRNIRDESFSTIPELTGPGSGPGDLTTRRPRPPEWATASSPPLSQRAFQVGMVRSGRDPRNRQRTQYVGGRPGAVRYTTKPFADWDLPPGSSVTPTYSRSSDLVGPRSNLDGSQVGEEERLRSYLGGRGFRAGGGVPGSSDTVPAWLTPNEFVVPREHADQIRVASGPALSNALSKLAVDIKTGQPPGNRPVGGREDFSMGGTVRDKNQPGYALGGPTSVNRYGDQNYQRPGVNRYGDPYPNRGSGTTVEVTPEYQWPPALTPSGSVYNPHADYPSYPRGPRGGGQSTRALFAEGGHLNRLERELGSAASRPTDENAKWNSPAGWVRTGRAMGLMDEPSPWSDQPVPFWATDRGREEKARAEDEAAARARREGLWGEASAANQRRKQMAIDKGADLRREAGELAREEHAVNTSQAARAALATASIQPVEASLSRASQMQLRSALHGAMIQSAANIEAERMSYQAEVDAINGELAIIGEKLKAEGSDIARAQYLEDQARAFEQREYFEDKAIDARLRLQKASDPGFWKSVAPSLITGGMSLLGSLFQGSGSFTRERQSHLGDVQRNPQEYGYGSSYVGGGRYIQ